MSASTLAASAPGADEVGARLGALETVLLVDENRLTRESGRRALRAHGYTVLEAASGQQALMASKRHRGDIAVVVTSVGLSDMNGYVLAERLRSQRPGLKLLLLVSSGRREDRESMLVRTHVVRKPFRPEVLGNALREVLDDAG